MGKCRPQVCSSTLSRASWRVLPDWWTAPTTSWNSRRAISDFVGSTLSPCSVPTSGCGVWACRDEPSSCWPCSFPFRPRARNIFGRRLILKNFGHKRMRCGSFRPAQSFEQTVTGPEKRRTAAHLTVDRGLQSRLIDGGRVWPFKFTPPAELSTPTWSGHKRMRCGSFRPAQSFEQTVTGPEKRRTAAHFFEVNGETYVKNRRVTGSPKHQNQSLKHHWLKLCSPKPFGFSGSQSCQMCGASEFDWRRGRGPVEDVTLCCWWTLLKHVETCLLQLISSYFHKLSQAEKSSAWKRSNTWPKPNAVNSQATWMPFTTEAVEDERDSDPVGVAKQRYVLKGFVIILRIIGSKRFFFKP